MSSVCRISFSSEALTLSFRGNQAPSDAADRRCNEYLLSHPPKHFYVTNSATNDGIYSKELVIQSSLVDQMPFLANVRSSCGTEADSEPVIELPFSMWWLVSLCVLLEGRTGVDDWFMASASHRASPSAELLPRNTHAVADYLGCKQTLAEIEAWLQHAIKMVSAKWMKCAETGRCMTSTYLIRVLTTFPEYLSRECDASQLSELPPSLMTCWLSERGQLIDLSCSTWETSHKWKTLTVAIAGTAPSSIKTLTLPRTSESWRDASKVLVSTQAIVSHTSSLQKLSFPGLRLLLANMHDFEMCVQAVPITLEELELRHLQFGADRDVRERLSSPVSEEERAGSTWLITRFVRAVSMMKHLKRLVLPPMKDVSTLARLFPDLVEQSWDMFSSHADVVSQYLSQIPRLEVHVPAFAVKKVAHMCPTIKFVALS